MFSTSSKCYFFDVQDIDPSPGQEFYWFTRFECVESENFIGYNPTTTISSTSDVQVYGSITAGEILIAFMLLVFAAVGLLDIIARALGSVNTKKTMVEYSNGDVPITKEL